MMRYLIFASLLLVVSCQEGLPKNIAGKLSDELIMPCKALKENPNYDYTTWRFIESQTGFTSQIARDSDISQNLQGLFELTSDTSKYDLKIKNINDFTTGTFECAGYKNDIAVDAFHAFAMYINSDLKKAETTVLDNYLGADNKIAYCYVDYGGPYPPSVKVETSASPIGTYHYEDTEYDLAHRAFTAGACALIKKTDTFNCEAEFGGPPIELITDITFDVSKPTLEAIKNTGTASNDANVPKWLKDRCLKFVKTLDYELVPQNTALSIGESTTLKCGRVNEATHTTGYWSFSSADNGDGAIIATNFKISPGLEDAFSMTDGKFDLTLKEMSRHSAGIYQCAGFKGETPDVAHTALVYALGNPQCSTQSEESLPSNQRIGYCFGDYFGSYSPTVNFTRESVSLISATFKREAAPLSTDFSVVGGCSLLLDNHNFKCQLKYGPPPPKQAEDINLDISAPTKVTECNSGSSPSPPEWLKTECLKLLRIDENGGNGANGQSMAFYTPLLAIGIVLKALL